MTRSHYIKSTRHSAPSPVSNDIAPGPISSGRPAGKIRHDQHGLIDALAFMDLTRVFRIDCRIAETRCSFLVAQRVLRARRSSCVTIG